MIHYVTGPLGAGKSAFGTRKMAQALLSGRVVATNIRFVDGWEKKLLKHAHHYRFAGRRAKREFELEVAERYFWTTELPTLVSLRLHGKGEGRGVRVIDEAHNELNNREWAENNQKAQLRKMTLARKRGWEDYILSQHKDNTDAALRRIASIEIRLLDWQQVTKLPFFGTKLLPFHLFLAQGYLVNFATVSNAQKPLFRELYPLGWWASLYDTWEDFGIPEDDAEAIWLPRRRSQEVTPIRGGPGDPTLTATEATGS